MPYPNSLLTERCEIILELDLSPDDIACLAADLPGEVQAHIESRNEAAWESYLASGEGSDASYRNSLRAAGRGHLIGD